MSLDSGLPQPGRELDAWIAEHVMGLVRCTNVCHTDGWDANTCYAQPDSPDRGGELEQYSTSAAFFQVMEATKDEWVWEFLEAPEGMQTAIYSHDPADYKAMSKNDIFWADYPDRERAYAHAVSVCAKLALEGEGG